MDAALRAGEPLGLLAGIPLGVKDSIAADEVDERGLENLDRFEVPHDARVIEALRKAGSGGRW